MNQTALQLPNVINALSIFALRRGVQYIVHITSFLRLKCRNEGLNLVDNVLLESHENVIEFGITRLDLSTLSVLVRIQLIMEATPILENNMDAFLQSVHLDVTQITHELTQILLDIRIWVNLLSFELTFENFKIFNNFFLEVIQYFLNYQHELIIFKNSGLNRQKLFE